MKNSAMLLDSALPPRGLCIGGNKEVFAFVPVLNRVEILRTLMASLAKCVQAGEYVSPPLTTTLVKQAFEISSAHSAGEHGGCQVRRVAERMVGVTFAVAALLRETYHHIPYEMTVGFKDAVSLGSETISVLVRGDGPTRCMSVSAQDHRGVVEVDAKTILDDINSFELELLGLWDISTLLEKHWPEALHLEQTMTFPGRARVTRGAICTRAKQIYARQKTLRNGLRGTIVIVETVVETASGIRIAEGTTTLFLPTC